MLTFQSIDALDFVRRDLNEFTTTVKNDTEVYLNKIKTQEVGFENQKIVCFFFNGLIQGDGLGINRFVSKFSDSSKVDNENEKHFQASASFDRAQVITNKRFFFINLIFLFFRKN